MGSDPLLRKSVVPGNGDFGTSIPDPHLKANRGNDSVGRNRLTIAFFRLAAARDFVRPSIENAPEKQMLLVHLVKGNVISLGNLIEMIHYRLILVASLYC